MENDLLFIVSVGMILINMVVWWCTWISIKSKKVQALDRADKLMRQQAHEDRDGIQTTISILRQLLDTTENETQRKELGQALNSLEEVEQQHQNRLFALRILRNAYVSRIESIDLISFMIENVERERRVNFSIESDKKIEWLVRLPKQYAHYKQLVVATNIQILQSILSQLLKNARKRTRRGHIMLSFEGLMNNCLIFNVEDSGSGVNPFLKNTLFSEQVVFGDTVQAQHRGNIDLPSCYVFARAAGGYLKIIENQEENKDNSCRGFSKFQVAVNGSIKNASQEITIIEDSYSYFFLPLPTIQLATNGTNIINDSPTIISTCTSTDCLDTLPKEASIIIVDDSIMCRMIMNRSLRKVQAERNWIYHEFDTIEKAQQCIQTTIALGGWTIITLDENLTGSGGILNGIDATTWITKDLGAPSNAIIISVSGEEGVGEKHIHLGAHLAWAKPLPKHSVIRQDLENVFAHRL